MSTPDDQGIINQREWEQPVNWTGWSGSYSSTRDTRLWVPKRPITGTGQALNFGHPHAKTFIAAMCIVPVVLLLILGLIRLID